MVATGTVQYLDVSKFGKDHSVRNVDPETNRIVDISLRGVCYRSRPAIDALQHTGLLAKVNSRDKEIISIGVTITNPDLTQEEVQELWNDPYELIHMAWGYGPDGAMCIANGARKTRASSRLMRNSLEINANDHGSFIDKVVAAEEDGRFKWGDFPWGGAVWIPLTNGKGFWIAVSAFKQDQDQTAGYMIGGAIATELERGIAYELALAA